VNELVFVSFLSEVEVGCDRVLEEVNDEVAHQDQKGGALAAQFQGGWENFHDGSGQHESRTQRYKILEIRTVPVLLDDDRAPEYVGGGGRETEKKTENYGMHAGG
jgi:hypothetical protein